MYRRSYPACKIKGSHEPVEAEGDCRVPAKCLNCEYRQGKDCTRAQVLMGRAQLLDSGPCFKKGPTRPVPLYELSRGFYVYILAKCHDCAFLKEQGKEAVCTWQADAWGEEGRSLDWGDFEPIHPLAGLEEGYLFSPRVLRLIRSDREGEATVLMRQMNPQLDHNEVRKVYKRLKDKIL